ncbi:MAG TPA: cytochrome b [Casimicrobiaceae bacterium]|nr:cytochrome b [Casimicrobiaceae bacterium]
MAAPPTERYGNAAVALHWVTAALIVGNLALGLSMVPLPLSPQKLRWYGWHKWVGITVFLLTWARLAWRWGHPAPAPVAMPAWQRRAAGVSHTFLYLLMLLVPISGWLYSSSTGVQVVYLGLVPLPDAVPKDKELAAILKNLHVTLNATMFALIALHVAAAFKHHFVDRNELLARMWPRLKGKEWA